MQLARPFLKLPIRFDAEALAAEVRALPSTAWTPHPTGFVGNEAVRLVTPGGRETDKSDGPMGPTSSLDNCDYIREIMAAIGAVWGRSRLMGLAPGKEVPPHIDINYYWRTHWRIHIPVVTNPAVLFTCGDETVHMAAGECWLFDSFRWHDVKNGGKDQRIHLVLDTVGGGRFGDLMKAAESGTAEPQLIGPGQHRGTELAYERFNSPTVMSPWEMRCHLAFIREHAGAAPEVLNVLARADQLLGDWTAVWARFGPADEGRPEYDRLLRKMREDLAALDASQIELPNKIPVGMMLTQLVLLKAISDPDTPIPDQRSSGQHMPTPQSEPFRSRFDRPIFIVSTPRSGSTLLYETLEKAPGLYSTGDESHKLIESIDGLTPPERNWSSNRLDEDDATSDRAEKLAQAFYRKLKDRGGSDVRESRIRMLEKTPKNALRIPFFRAVWPDAKFIYLYRDVRETLYSMMEAWHSGRFRTYPGLPGWRGPRWSMLLVPDWQKLNGLQLPEIAAHQWAITTEILLDDLEQLDAGNVEVVDYRTFLGSPQSEIQRIANSVGLDWDRELESALPLSKTTLSRPQQDKWRSIEPVIQSIWPIVERADKRARAFVEQRLAVPSAA